MVYFSTPCYVYKKSRERWMIIMKVMRKLTQFHWFYSNRSNYKTQFRAWLRHCKNYANWLERTTA